MNDWGKLIVFLAGVGSVLYGLRLPEDDIMRWVFIIPGALAIIGILLLMGGKHRYARKIGFTSGKTSLATVLILLIIIGLGVYLLKEHGYLSGIPGAPKPPAESKKIALSLPIRFNFMAGGVSFSALQNLDNPPRASLSKIMIYKNGVLWESISVTDVTNIVTSLKYRSGERLHLVLNYSYGTSTFYQSVDVTVPYVDKETAEIVPPTEHEINVDVGAVPAVSAEIVMLDDMGSPVPDGAKLGAGTYKVMVSVPEDKAGLAKATIPQTDGSAVTYNGGVIVQSTASAIDIPGGNLIYSGPNNYIYYVPISIKNSHGTFTLKVLGGASANITISVYQNLDLSYLGRVGTTNADAVMIGQFMASTVSSTV